MKKILFFLVLSFGFAALAKSQLQVNVQWLKTTSGIKKDTLYYSPQAKLTWNDFYVRKEEGTNTAALTTSGFGFTAGIFSRSGQGLLDINVFCYFLPYKSWVKKGDTNDYILNHEQHHFDISYIGSCYFMQKLKEARITMNNYSSVISKIYDEAYDYMSNMQDAYDRETDNGIIREKQEDWNKKVNARLTDL